MFAILYQRSHDPVNVIETDDGLTVNGQWLVDTDEDGSVAQIDDLETALNRVKDIRQKGGEACLVTIIE